MLTCTKAYMLVQLRICLFVPGITCAGAGMLFVERSQIQCVSFE